MMLTEMTTMPMKMPMKKIPRSNLPPTSFPHCDFIECGYFVHAGQFPAILIFFVMIIMVMMVTISSLKTCSITRLRRMWHRGAIY